MNAKEIKILLIQKGLTIAEIAEEISAKTKIKKSSMQTMVADTLYGRRWYQNVADELANSYGIKLVRPAHTLPLRQQMKRVA